MYIDHVMVAVEEATEEVLKRLAFRIVERAQLNIRNNVQIDTGFMVNSGYPIWKGGSGFSAAESAALAQAEKEIIEEQLAEDAAAGVVWGANYSIYQEALKPFLWPAAVSAASEFGGEAEQVFKEMVKDG